MVKIMLSWITRGSQSQGPAQKYILAHAIDIGDVGQNPSSSYYDEELWFQSRSKGFAYIIICLGIALLSKVFRWYF